MLAASVARKQSEVRSSTKLENGFPRKATVGSVGDIDAQTTSEGTHQIQLKESLRKVRNARNVLSKKASLNASSYDLQSEQEASGEYEFSHHDQLNNSKTSSLKPPHLMQA